MKQHLANLDGKIVDFAEAVPVCGTDYCDDCGDCLSCCSGDPCRASKSGAHRWVTYVGDAGSASRPTKPLRPILVGKCTQA